MIQEVLALLAGLGVLVLTGIGPAVWLVGESEQRWAFALGIAPALAVSLLGIIGFPLVKYLEPAQVWAAPVVLALVALSAFLVFWYWRNHRTTRDELAPQRTSILAGAGFAVVVGALLVLPIVFLGIQYTVFRSNPSDSFYYMSLAETARTADWHTIQAGATPSPGNLKGMGELAHVSPTSLLTARFTRPFSQLGMPTSLAMFAQLSGLPVYEAFYPFQLLLFLSASLVALVLGDLLRIPVLLKFLAAAAVAVGFWAHFILELGSGGEIASIPVLLLFVFAWIQLEQEPLRLVTPTRLLLALAATALVCYYTPIVIVVAFALVLYYAFALILRRVRFRAILYQGATLLLAVFILLVTGQLDNIILTFRFLLFTNVAAQDLFPAASWQVVRTDLLAGLWGLPRSLMVDVQSSTLTLVLRRFMDVLAVVATGALLVAAYLVIRKPRRVAEQIVLAVVTSGLIISAVMLLRENERTAGKAIGYIYPYLILGALIPTSRLGAVKNVWLKGALVAALALWLGIQILWGTYLPFIAKPKGLFENALNFRDRSFQVEPIESFLEEHPPRLLLVNVPRDKSWVYAFYTMFVFQRFPAYFQSGVVVDNSTRVQNLWFQEMPAVPDYALMLRQADYLQGTSVGTAVAETPDLVLYRVDAQDPQFFKQHEQAMRESEMLKPFHQPAPLQ